MGINTLVTNNSGLSSPATALSPAASSPTDEEAVAVQAAVCGAVATAQGQQAEAREMAALLREGGDAAEETGVGGVQCASDGVHGEEATHVVPSEGPEAGHEPRAAGGGARVRPGSSGSSSSSDSNDSDASARSNERAAYALKMLEDSVPMRH